MEAVEELLTSEFARTPLELNEWQITRIRNRVSVVSRVEREQSLQWVTAVRDAVVGNNVAPTNELVRILTGFACGRVGAAMAPEARNHAWAVFKFWSTVPEFFSAIDEDTIRVLRTECALLCLEDFDDEYGQHVLSETFLWNELIPVATSIPGIGWVENQAAV